MAVKIKLQRVGKIRNAQYRVVVADARTRRDGRVIENIGIYHPRKSLPSSRSIPSVHSTGWALALSRPSRSSLCSR